MQKFALALLPVIALSACVDPLRNVDRFSSVDMPQDTAVVGVAPTEATQAANPACGGFLSRILSRDTPEPAAETDLAVQAALASAQDAVTEGAAGVAGGAALDGAASPADAAVTAQSATNAPAAPVRRGLFSRLRGGNIANAAQAAEPANAVASPLDTQTAVDTALAGLADEEKTQQVIAQAPQAQARPRGGLFGLLSGARAKSQSDSDGAETLVRTASIAPAAPASAVRARASSGPDGAVVPMGTRLSSGAVARVCDLPRGRLGKEVARYPERGQGYKIYDSAPRSAGPRPFYVTGFNDKCARTFTASLALFASPTLHEQLRYGLPAKQMPYSATDKAYETIKVSVCKVSRRQPCGSKVGLLEKNTAFISIYDRIGSNKQWSNMLVHRGKVLAVDRKG